VDSVLDTLPVSSSYRYLIQDPYHEYGVQFIEHIYRKYGYRAICLYTDRRERLFHEASMPQLRSDCVAAAYDAGPGRIHHIIERLREDGDVLAVIPFNETSILSATEIAARLGLSWAQPDVMRRFRDKYALKHYLRGTQSALRINASQTVRTSFEVLSLRHKDPYRRFVLKPNDGYGNRHIGFFDDASPDAEIDGLCSAIIRRGYLAVNRETRKSPVRRD